MRANRSVALKLLAMAAVVITVGGAVAAAQTVDPRKKPAAARPAAARTVKPVRPAVAPRVAPRAVPPARAIGTRPVVRPPVATAPPLPGRTTATPPLPSNANIGARPPLSRNPALGPQPPSGAAGIAPGPGIGGAARTSALPPAGGTQRALANRPPLGTNAGRRSLPGGANARGPAGGLRQSALPRRGLTLPRPGQGLARPGQGLARSAVALPRSGPGRFGGSRAWTVARQRYFVAPPRSAGPPPGQGIGRTRAEMQYSGVPPRGEVRFVSNEVVVQVANTVPRAQVEAAARQLGIAVVATHGFDAAGRTMYQFRSSGGRDVRDVIRQLEQNRIVAAAQPNYVYRLEQSTVPAAPAPLLWMQGPGAPAWPAPPPPSLAPPRVPAASLPPPATPPAASAAAPPAPEAAPTSLPPHPLPAGDPTQYAIAKLHLAEVHQQARGRDVTIAVVDSEIDERHPDLQGAIAEHFDPAGGPSRPHTHGTGMAGAIVARARLLGVAPDASIVAVKVFDDRSAGAEATSFQILKGLDYAVQRGVRIINMSFAGPYDVMIERKLREAYDKGIILVAAAGNAGPKSPPLYPAADPSVIAVSATDYTDKPFAMANRGNHIAIAAPGVDILVPSPGGSYQLTTGTSVAAAQVSGVIALMLEKRPDLTPEDVRAILAGSAHPLAGVPDNTVGAGLVDPVQALTYEPPVDPTPAAAQAAPAVGTAAQ